MTWHKGGRRKAQYTDANGKRRFIGLFDTQEVPSYTPPQRGEIRRAGLEGRRKTNRSSTGSSCQKRKADGHGWP